jgi:hypothetical protein
MYGNSEAQERLPFTIYYACVHGMTYFCLEKMTAVMGNKYPVRLLAYLYVEWSNINMAMPFH